jgi:hypothetical protein
MTTLNAVFTSKKQLAAFIVKAKACDFETPVCGEAVSMVRFTIAVKSATDFIYSLADRLDGTIYSTAS